MQPQPRNRHKTVLIIIIVAVVAVLIVLGVVLYTMTLGITFVDPSVPLATYNKSHVAGGWQINIVSISQKHVSWDDILVSVTDGTNFAEWGPKISDLDGGHNVTAPYAEKVLNNLSVTLTVTDARGNGVVDATDYFTLTADPAFSSAMTYTAFVLHEPTSAQIGDGIGFTG